MESMPTGFRFHPTDEELVNAYLMPKMNGDEFRAVIIPEIDVCKHEPWDLPHIFQSNSAIKTQEEWFFLCSLHFKSSNNSRLNRATESGFWKVTGKDLKIKARGTNNVIGTKKFLVFYKGRVPNEARTNWVMHEYHPYETLPNQRAFVLCRLRKKEDRRGMQSPFGATDHQEEDYIEYMEQLPPIADLN